MGDGLRRQSMMGGVRVHLPCDELSRETWSTATRPSLPNDFVVDILY